MHASLYAVAAIPFAGDALKGGVLIEKGINKAGAQGGREIFGRAALVVGKKAIDLPLPKGKNGWKFSGMKSFYYALTNQAHAKQKV